MKTVVVTGGAKGIGGAISRLFAEAGYNVVVNYRSSSNAASSLVEELQGRHYSVCSKRADVSNYEQTGHLIDFACETYGGIDVLINNAGEALYSLFTDTTPEQWDNIMNSNVKSAYNCSSHAVPYMLKNHSGSIINISSVWGITGASCEVAYSASKAALIGFTKSLAKELALCGIRVNCVAPGVVDTDMLGSLSANETQTLKDDIPLGKFAQPCDIAKAVLFLASANAGYFTGQIISPNGGLVI